MPDLRVVYNVERTRVVSAGKVGPAGPNVLSSTTATALTGYLRGDGAVVYASAAIPVADVTGAARLAGGNTFTGTQRVQALLAVQQAAGTPGTHEVQVYHDGTDGYVEAKAGKLRLKPAGGEIWLYGDTAYNPARILYDGQVEAGAYLLRGVPSFYLSASRMQLDAVQTIGWSTDAVNRDTTLSRNSSGTAGGLHATTTVTGADILTIQLPASATGKGWVVKNSVNAQVAALSTVNGTDFVLQDSSGNYVLRGYAGTSNVDLYGSVRVTAGSSQRLQLLSDSYQIVWGSGNVGLCQSASGVLKVTNGSTGLGDIRLQKLIAQQASGTPGTHEVQVYHDGTRSRVLSLSGDIVVGGPDGAYLEKAGGANGRIGVRADGAGGFVENPSRFWVDQLTMGSGDTTFGRNTSGTAGGLHATTTVTGADLLTLQGPASQTGHYLNLKNSVGTSVFRVEYRDANTVKLDWQSGHNLYLGSNISLRRGGGGADGTSQLNIQDVQICANSDLKMKFLFDNGTSPIALLASHATLAWGNATNLGGSTTGNVGLARHAEGVLKVTDGSTGFGHLRVGGVRINQNTAPADGDIVAGELALWFDSTNGASKLKLKGKSADGTVVTGEVALAP